MKTQAEITGMQPQAKKASGHQWSPEAATGKEAGILISNFRQILQLLELKGSPLHCKR